MNHPVRFLNTVLIAQCFLAMGTATQIGATPPRDTMYVEGRFLYSAAGEKVIARGVNEMFVWSDDIRGEIIYPEIEKSGANIVRIVWTTEGDFDDLDKNIRNCLEHKMIPMLELHDATGKIEKVPELVDFWIRPEMLDTIERYKKWLIVNIANEAGNSETTRSQFVDTYTSAISRIRGAGVKTPLVIDASNWGQDEEMILDTWEELLNLDPLKSTMFSVHTYWIDNQEDRLSSLISAVVDQQIPFLFGEGPQQVGWNCESEFPWQKLLALCQQHEIGWIAWSWGFMNNGDCAPGKFDMTTNGIFGHWENDWGEGIIVKDPNSISNTSIRPTSLLTSDPIGQTAQ